MDDEVLYEATVQGSEFGHAWKDVQAARGAKSDQPPTRAVRLVAKPDGITLCCFCPDLMLVVDVQAVVSISGDTDEQIAVLDDYKIAGHILNGMMREDGEAVIRILPADGNSDDGLWSPGRLTIEWKGNKVAIPVAEMAPAKFEAVEALVSLNTETLPMTTDGWAPGPLARLGKLHKFIETRKYGDDMPIAIQTADGVRGAVMAHLMTIRSPQRGDTAVAVEVEAIRFLDSMATTKPVNPAPPKEDGPPQDETLDDEWMEPKPELDGPDPDDEP